MTSRSTPSPARDARAVHHPAPSGRYRITEDRHVAIIGGGIAGLSAAAVLAERGVRVTMIESDSRLGGRVSAWPLGDGRTMSRGFHAFFRQYYNLRTLLMRVDPDLKRLISVEDYPLQRPDGVRDSFTHIPRTPPWNVMGFVAKSPTFTARSLLKVNIPAALELLRVRFPETYSAYDGESAAAFLDRLRFPADARALALEVFARSFFADPEDFAAGELIAMFHTYFLGSAEGLIFDVPDDDYDTALWAPLGSYLADFGVDIQFDCRATSIALEADGVSIETSNGALRADAVVVAADPRNARDLIATISDPAVDSWQRSVARTRNAPPFMVLRQWLSGNVAPERPAFLATSGYGPLDNVSVLERFEAGAGNWAKERGSVVELHAYACPEEVATSDQAAEEMAAELRHQLHRVYPETAHQEVEHEEVLIQDDCSLIDPSGWEARPSVATPSSRLVLAGDWVRCDFPVALMERATTTGYLAANTLLEQWGVQGQGIWTAPMAGLLASRTARKVR